MKSVFAEMKERMCKEIMKTKTLTKLKDKLNEILLEWDFEEEEN